MQIVIKGKAIFGNENFPKIKNMKRLCFGVYGDFRKPYYHKALCLEFVDEDGIFRYEIIGEFSHSLTIRKFLFWGGIKRIFLFGFESSYQEQQIVSLIENMKGK